MKKIIINFEYDYLSNGSFRNKVDIIKLCINYIRFAHIYYDQKNKIDCNTVLLIDKMKRLFIKYQDTIHSIQFPFNLINDNNRLVFKFEDKELNAKIASILLDFFNRFDQFESMEDMYEIFLTIIDENDIKDQYMENYLWKLVCHLMVFEAAYLRYDIDFSVRSKDKNKHPPYHFDINYSNSTTFKLGLQRSISLEEYIDILDNSKERVFLKI